MINKITIGADPELFIINTKTGKVVSSIGIIPGVKDNPYVEGFPKGFGVEIDNILGEFNIPPVRTKQKFIENINFMKSWFRDYVKNINPDYDIQCKASNMVDDDQLQSEEAKLFGCDPDYNAYTEDVNPKPKGDKGNLRSAGFHIHVGYPKFNPVDSVRLIKYMDAYLGLPSVLLDPDTKRRNLYGKAGSFRLQPWGVEYRVLSSEMLNDKNLEFVWNQLEKAIKAWTNGTMLPDAASVQKAINTSDAKLAKDIITQYNII